MLLRIPSPFFPGILLSGKPPETQGKRLLERTMVENNGWNQPMECSAGGVARVGRDPGGAESAVRSHLGVCPRRREAETPPPIFAHGKDHTGYPFFGLLKEKQKEATHFVSWRVPYFKTKPHVPSQQEDGRPKGCGHPQIAPRLCVFAFATRMSLRSRPKPR